VQDLVGCARISGGCKERGWGFFAARRGIISRKWGVGLDVSGGIREWGGAGKM